MLLEAAANMQHPEEKLTSQPPHGVAPAHVAPAGMQDDDLAVRVLCLFLDAAASITREEIRLTTVCQTLRQHYIDSGLRTAVENTKLQVSPPCITHSFRAPVGGLACGST